MRIQTNLATQPYQDVREFYSRWGLGLALLGVVTALLVGVAILRWTQVRTISRQIGEARAQVAELDKQSQQAQAVLNRPENRQTRERSDFVNNLIARKAFSWTQIFTDLEQLMPARAYVVSIRPVLTPQNELQLDLTVAANTREHVLELVRRMETSPRFRNPDLRSEFVESSDQEGTVRFEVGAMYVPLVPETSAAAQPAPAGGGR